MAKPVIILVRPQMGENIGAVARAMANFGLSEMRLVAPREAWPNPKAEKLASGADYILKDAAVFSTLADALADIQLVFATSARPRDIEKRVLEPEGAMDEIRANTSSGMKTAILFGPERTGLENDEIANCDTLIAIPTAPEHSSLNLAQSMVVIGYEWFRRSNAVPKVGRDFPDVAPQKDWQELFDQLEAYLDEADYYRAEHKKPVMWQNLKNMLLRSRMSEQEIRTFRGVLRILWEGRQPGTKKRSSRS